MLTELSPLARYGHLAVLAQWSDLAARRRQAIWAVVPQMINNYGPLVNSRPLPLAAPASSCGSTPSGSPQPRRR